MSGQEPQLEMHDSALQRAVASLMKLPDEELDSLNMYSVQTCEERIADLVDHVEDPRGKPPRSVPEVLGQIALLLQRKAEARIRELQTQVGGLQACVTSLQLECTDLAKEVDCRDSAIAQLQTERSAPPLPPPQEGSEEDLEPPNEETLQLVQN